MASYLDKAQVNTAITDNTKLDLGHQHITTADFMQLNVAYLHEMVPGSKIDIKMETFARLNPLPVPTFGRAAMRNRAFFVPFRTIFRGWNDFITDAVHIASDGYSPSGTGLLSTCPIVDMSVLADVFKHSIGTGVNDDNALLYEPDVAINYDVSWPNASLYNYTVRGRQCIKLLESLGYKLDFGAAKGACVLSALPLLALAKVYVDWYFPQQYANVSTYDNLLSLCNYDVSSGPLQLTETQVRILLRMCSYVQYDSDYFVSAWDTPNQPNSGNHTDFKLVNIDKIGTLYGGTTSYTVLEQNGVSNRSSAGIATGDAVDRYGSLTAPFITGYINVANAAGNLTVLTGGISEYLLHSLHALTDYMKRHQLAGSRAFDRYLARFGKALPAEKLNRSVYLGCASQDIQIGDVMSTSDTAAVSSGSQLGSFAGKGISYGNGQFDYTTDEFGYIIILSSIVPATGYFQGIDRQVMRTTKTEFWTPEFDSLGVQPITAVELFVPQDAREMPAGNGFLQIFGFVPRYASYKVAHDQLTGNFRLLSLNGRSLVNAADSWHLMRVFDSADFSDDYNNVVHSYPFILGENDYSQYKRIFYSNSEDDPDNITVIHNFEIAEYAPMKALYDVYEFEDKGKQVTLDVNGVKAN